jgi:hypothetical protein
MEMRQLRYFATVADITPQPLLQGKSIIYRNYLAPVL